MRWASLPYFALLALWPLTLPAAEVAVIDLSDYPPVRVEVDHVGHMNHDIITESSGLTASRQHKDVLWTLNDSGNSAKIFPLRLDGRLVKSAESAGITLEGAENFDWESMTSDDQGVLYIADSGQNFDFARTPIIYAVDEPDTLIGVNSVPVLRTIPYRYEDQSGFFMPRVEFDVEAIFYADQHLYLLTKGWGKGVSNKGISKWYRLDEQRSGLDGTARLQARIDFGGALVTGAEVDPSGLRLAVLAKRSVWLFEREAQGQDWWKGSIRHLRTRDIGVAEGICFYGDRLYISTEEGELYAIRLENLEE